MTDRCLTLNMPVEDGRLCPTTEHKRIIAAYLSQRDGKNVTVRFSRPTKARSNQQNRYYWGVVLSMIAAETGHTTEDMHDFFKDSFLPRRHITIAGKERETGKSTAGLDTQEFAAYLEHVLAFAGRELGMRIPMPNEI